MADYADAFGVVADDDTWMPVVIALGAFLAGTLLQHVIEQRAGVDVPVDEVYGIAVIIAANMQFSGDTAMYATIGGGIHTAEALARRFGLKQRLQDAMGSGGDA